MDSVDDGGIFLVLTLACGVPLILLALGAIWFVVFRRTHSSAAKIIVSVICGFAGVLTLLSALAGVIVYAGGAVVAKYGPPPTYFSTPVRVPYEPTDSVVPEYGPPPTEEPIQVLYGPPPTKQPIQLMYGPPPTEER